MKRILYFADALVTGMPVRTTVTAGRGIFYDDDGRRITRETHYANRLECAKRIQQDLNAIVAKMLPDPTNLTYFKLHNKLDRITTYLNRQLQRA